jgi:hypothetical protein
MDGSDRKKPFIIKKSQRPHCFQGNKNSSMSIQIKEKSMDYNQAVRSVTEGYQYENGVL